jgi:hypothetical protein
MRKPRSAWRRTVSLVAALALGSSLITASIAPVAAQLINAAPVTSSAPAAVTTTFGSSTQFDLTGFLQTATLDQACVTAAGSALDADGNPQVAHCGGTLMVNNHIVVVPAETVVILPASALTWQELFAQAPAPYTGTATGMALADVPAPYTTYEFNVIGNRVKDPNGTNGCTTAGGCDRYIAGLIHVSQQDLNSGAGYINFIDYTTGDFEVGGQLNVAGTGALVRINDPIAAGTFGATPTGRYTRGAPSPDGRFQVDQDNPTILSATGFPMCIPRVTADPNTAGNPDDALCPLGNRPISAGGADPITGQQHPPAGEFDSFFTMRAPGAGFPDPTIQAPMEVGDYVNYAGTLVKGAAGADYISAHTVVDNTAIYTQPGIDPAYVSIEVGLIGTGGLTIFGAGEAAIRTRFEGMTTDPSRNIHLYGIDINPATGQTTDRDWGSIGVDPGPPNGAVKGRWRFRPPCTVTIATDKKCVGPPNGSFLPPTREVRAVIEGLQQFLPGTSTPNPASQVPGSGTEVASANGIFYGQYHAPIGEYIFPENVPGQPIPENNFNTIDFLAYGGYASFSGVKVGVLNPWPSNVIPSARVCATPTFNGAPYSVANGGSISLSGSVNANASSPVNLSWTAGTTVGGTDLNAALTNATTTTPTFSAIGLAAGVYNLRFTATNVCGAASVDTTITVQAAPPPTVNAIQNQTVTLGSAAASPVTIVATSASLPAPTFAWTQTSGAAVAFTQTPTAATATATSTIRFTPAAAGVYSFSVTATNANGTSPAVFVNITVTAATPTNVVLTPAEYRIGKQRLVLTATTTDVANVTSMVLQPYLTETGTTFDPASLGAAALTNTGGGIFTLTAVGVPKPACNLGGTYATPCAQRPLIVKSFNNLNQLIGTSAPTALDRIRQ